MRLTLVILLMLAPIGGGQVASPPASPACGMIPSTVHPDPGALAQDYLERVNDGQFLSRWENAEPRSVFASYTPWLREAVRCPAQLPSIEHAATPVVVVARYSAGSLEQSGESAVVSVTYDELGRLERGTFTPERRQSTLPLSLRRTPWGWRLERHDAVQRVAAAAVLNRIGLRTETQEQVQAVFDARRDAVPLATDEIQPASISLRREGHCGFGLEDPTDIGQCPTYTITATGEGTVVYEGRVGVRTIGKRTHTLAIDEFRKLLAEFVLVDFFALRDRYKSIVLAGGLQQDIDHSVAMTLTLSMTGKTKSIYAFYGTPIVVHRLGIRVDQVTDSGRYTGREPGR